MKIIKTIIRDILCSLTFHKTEYEREYLGEIFGKGMHTENWKEVCVHCGEVIDEGGGTSMSFNVKL